MAERGTGSGVEPAAVVPHRDGQATIVADHVDPGARGPGVTGDVAQRLVDDAQEVARDRLRRLRRTLADRQLDVHDRVVAELFDECSETSEQRGPAQELRAQPKDEVADVADRQVEGVDGPLDALDDLVGVLGDELRHVLERQPDGVDALDDPVVEVLADALALVDDGEPVDLLVQPGVLDRDRRHAGRTSRRVPGRSP